MTHDLPYLASEPPPQDTDDILYANGIFAETGLPLCQLETSELVEIVGGETMSKTEEQQSRHKHTDATVPHYGTVGDVDPNELAETGWGIVFPAKGDPAIKAALEPLIEHRRKQVGDDSLFKIFEGADGFRPDDDCPGWLARHGVALSVVDPLEGVPFYLLLVGSPYEIPFEAQYLLDIYWGVGRLHFDAPDDYRRYAESVVEYETADSVPHSRKAAIFSTCHEGDKATEMFTELVAGPLAHGQEARDGKPARPPLGQRQKFEIQSLIGETATKENLGLLLGGKHDGGSPALLLTGSHGMGFAPDDERIEAAQGALVCQDWPGWGSIEAEHWFAADDLSADAKIHGLVHFFFACFGAGCPLKDDFMVKPNTSPKQIAPRAFVSRLPQKMLTHPGGGALAALGHVDRAWSTSFHSAKAGPQLQGFRDVMTRLMRGDRIGQATDQFDVRKAALSAQLIDLRTDMEFGKLVHPTEVASLWIARNDARNYVVLGDPAVRLRMD